jgi:hypothetical protein
MNETALVVFLSIGLVLLLRWLRKTQQRREIQQSEEWERERLSDENVLKAQSEFERRLDKNADLPDSIVWKKANTYRHLMKKWFAALTAQHRYDDVMSSKLKLDWLNYLYLLERESIVSFLTAEATDEKKRESYHKEFRQMREQYMAIEDGFSAAIGKEATAELQRVRTAAGDSFDRSGIKPMAPEGFYYFQVSLHPYDDELKKRDS